MTLEERTALADQLAGVVIGKLSPELFTGTGQEMRERKQEIARLTAKVMAAVLYDGLPSSEQVFRAKTLEAKIARGAEKLGGQAWLAALSGEEDDRNV